MQLIMTVLVVLGLSACSSTEITEKVSSPLSLTDNDTSPIVREPKKLLVVEPLNTSKRGEKLLEKAALSFIESWIALNGTFVYFPKDDLETEDKFLASDKTYDVEKLLDVANEQGISALLVPEIEEVEIKSEGDEEGFFRNRKLTTSARVRVRVFDVKTRKQILSRRRTANFTEGQTTFLGGDDTAEYNPEHAEEAVKLALNELLELLPKYAKRIDWIGQIVRVDDARLYLDSGRITGLKLGQILTVYEPLHRVPNEISKGPLGIARGPLRGTIKIVEFIGEDGAFALAHSGRGFQARDHVEMFLPRHLH